MKIDWRDVSSVIGLVSMGSGLYIIHPPLVLIEIGAFCLFISFWRMGGK